MCQVREKRQFSSWTKGVLACLLLLALLPTNVFAQEEQEGETSRRKTNFDEMVVTGTRTERSILDVPVRTELISRSGIETIQADTLADAVEWTTGIRAEQNCQNCNFSQIRLLGLDGQYSQILYDSQPTISSLAAVYGVEHIPALLIDRIEVIKGGGSSLYGSGAVAGVLNIIPREATENGGSLGASYSLSDGKNLYGVNAAGEIVSKDKLSGMFFYGHTRYTSPIDLTDDGYTEIGKRQLDAFGFRAHRYLLDKSAKLVLDYSRMYEDRRGGDQLDVPEFMANIAESIQTSRDSVLASWSHTVSSDFDYHLGLSFAKTKRDSYYGAGMDPNAYGTTDNPYWVYDAQFNHHFDAAGMHTLSWGVQGSIDSLEDSQPAYDFATDEDYTNVGVFIQDDWAFHDTWALVAGLRMDDNSEVDNVIFAPRAALMWNAGQDLRARLSVASGFLAPRVFDEDLHITQVGGEGVIIRNAEDIEEEKSLNVSLGVEYTPEIGYALSLIDVNVFWTELDDTFSVDEADDESTEGTLEFVRSNRGGASVYGVEFNLGYGVPEEYQIDLGYVEQRSEYDDADPDFGSKDFFRTPERYGQLKVTVGDVDRHGQIFLGVRYTGKMQVPHYAGYIAEDRLDESDSFITIDANVSKSFDLGSKGTKFVLSAGGKNLTDEYQDDLDQGMDRDAGYVYGPRFPRTLFVEANYKF